MRRLAEALREARILIVEDEALIAEELRERLSRVGANIVGVADTGAAAVRIAQDTNPDLVLMDIRLKGAMTGIEASETIRRETGSPVVFLTAHSDLETVLRAKRADPFGYVLKPFSEADLIATLEVALHRHGLEKQLVASEQTQRLLAEELSRLNEDLERTNLELAALSTQLLTIQDDERARIAYDLHDDLGQLLTVTLMTLEKVATQIPDDMPAVQEDVRRTLDSVLLAASAMRAIVKQLSPVPLETLGLVPTLEQQVLDLTAHSGLDCTLEVEPEDLDLDIARGTMVVRVIQEALTNILRHAHATRAEVRLVCRDHQGVLTIRDNGRGMPASKMRSKDSTSIGLVSIRTRARSFGGGLEIHPAEGGGTTLIVTFRLPDPG